ncbi:MAG: adenosylmethionine decarboxylase [Desulfurococcaceae archaeon]
MMEIAPRVVHRNKNVYKVYGKHIYGELYDCRREYLSDLDFLMNITSEAVRIGGFTLLDIKGWKIEPGVSVVAIILESHVAIHTWPEYSFVTLDVYTCGYKGDPFKTYRYIVDKLEAKKFTIKISDRSLVMGQSE